MAKTTIRYINNNVERPEGPVRSHLESDTLKIKSALTARVRQPGLEWVDYGVVSTRIVTNAAIADLVSVMLGGSPTALQNYRYHASGTGSTPESASDTALVSEVESRDTGTQTSPGPGQYQTVATHTYASSFTITEHGIFSAATGGVLLDRSVFTGIPVINGTEIEWTYTLTITGS